MAHSTPSPQSAARFRRVVIGPLLSLVAALLLSSACSDEPAAGTSTISVSGVDVHVIDQRPSPPDAAAVTPVLLHGASFDAQTWIDNGVMDHLVDSGVGVVAVDLPGHGNTPDADVDPGPFLLDTLDALGIDKPVVVAPSMSGGYALAALEIDPSRFAGLVPVAPVGVEELTEIAADDAPVTMIVWGADDEVIPLSTARDLEEKIPSSWVEIIPEAGHAAYQDQTEAFEVLLDSFISSVDAVK